MASSRRINNPTTELTLSASEASWLKAVLQNPLERPLEPDEEDPFNKKMRLSIFDCLSFS
jgi:hypothetical protein